MIHFLWVLGCVFPRFLFTNELNIQNILHPKCGEARPSLTSAALPERCWDDSCSSARRVLHSAGSYGREHRSDACACQHRHSKLATWATMSPLVATAKSSALAMGVYEYQIRVLYPHEDPSGWAAGEWIFTSGFYPDAKRTCFDAWRHWWCGRWTKLKTAGGLGRYTNTGHMTEPGALVVPFVLGRDLSVVEVFAAHRRTYDRSRTFACAHCALMLLALLFYLCWPHRPVAQPANVDMLSSLSVILRWPGRLFVATYWQLTSGERSAMFARLSWVRQFPHTTLSSARVSRWGGVFLCAPHFQSAQFRVWLHTCTDFPSFRREKMNLFLRMKLREICMQEMYTVHTSQASVLKVLHHITWLICWASLKIPSSPSSHAVSAVLLYITPISTSWHSPRSTTSSSAPLSITPCATVTRNEERGPMATGYEPNLFDIPEDHDDIDEIFTDRNFTQLIYDSDGQYPDPGWSRGRAPQERICLTTANAGERGAKTDLTQTHHVHEESLLRRAPLISARTENPGSVLIEREWSQGLEDEILMSALQVQREQILA